MAFLLPPGIFILALFAAAYRCKRYRTPFIVIAILFYLLSTRLVGVWLAKPLENAYAPPASLPKTIDAIVVPGGGNYLGTPNLPLLEGNMKRLLYGIMLAKKYNLPIIYTGGYRDPAAVTETVHELNEMLDLNLTMPKKFVHHFSLYLETESRNTHENALFTKAFLHKAGISKPQICLVTSAFHMRRANMIFQKVGFQTIPAPTDFKAVLAANLNWLPETNALQLSYLALHEYLGYLRYLYKN